MQPWYKRFSTAGDGEGGRLEPDSLTSGARKMTLLKSTGKKVEQF